MARRSASSVAGLLLALVAALAVGACGGGEGTGSASSESVGTLLRDTFSGAKRVDSGKLTLGVVVDAQGTGRVDGPVDLSLSGPFKSNGKGRLPSFALDARFSGAGQSVQGGITSTGDRGFVSFQGQDYAVTPQILRQFRRAFEQSQRRQGNGRSLASLGIDPRRWLDRPRKAGEAKVGDTDTIRITGRVDVPAMLDDVNRALARASALDPGRLSGQVPQRLTARQKREVQDAIKRLDVEILTGKDDHILRRLRIDMDLRAPGNQAGVRSARTTFDLQLTGVNEPQRIDAPQDAKPLADLMRQLGGLGLGLGAAGGAGGAGASGGASSQALERYADCIRAAGSDATKAQKCADLLTP